MISLDISQSKFVDILENAITILFYKAVRCTVKI